MEEIFIEIFVITFGLLIGSFLNVVIARLPEEKSIIKPASHCPKCGFFLKFYHNIPVLSYLFLGGKCAKCKNKISWQYPAVEAFTGLTFYLVYITHFPVVVEITAGVIFLSIMIALAIIDFQHMILPDELTLGGTAFFLIYIVVFHNKTLIIEHIIASLIFPGLFYLLYFFYLKVKKIEALGLGDVKMAFLLGIFLGLEKSLITLMIASFSGLAVGLILMAFQDKNLKSKLPFGTFLAIGAYISYFYGGIIYNYIINLY